MRNTATAVVGVLLILLVYARFAWVTPRSPGASPVGTAGMTLALTFVGGAECASCHRLEAERWRSSMHARAMQVPSSAAVSAPFAGERFSLHGTASTFSTHDGRYIVRTDGPDAALHEYEVAYTFGVYPLQQYLLRLPGGRLQALGVTWDARGAPAGRRWYHLYPERQLRPDDPLHWTSRSQNWNFMCADCHSTNVRKNYVAADDRYQTTWTDLSVACEACHGAGSRHVAWARQRQSTAGLRPGEDDGLTPLRAFDGASWIMSSSSGIAHRDRPRSSHEEIEMCARCHSRREQLTDDVHVGEPLANSFRPALLDADLYFADGQIKGEVYEYGSFLQSRMYANGVTCSDCHEPHRPEVSSAPDNLCRRCHQAETFATPAHHHHAEGSTGSSCVTCHMPARTYMTIDQRRDHSFRVPRPDLTMKIGTPNTCAVCHANRSAQWAADEIRGWFGNARTLRPHYGEAIAAARSGAPDAEQRLTAVIDDPDVPTIVRATAVSLLAGRINPQTGPVLQRMTFDSDPLVRMAAVDVLTPLPETLRARLLTRLLADPVRAVRIEAARALVTVPDGDFAESDRTRRAHGVDEWKAVQGFNADTAGAHVNLGAFYAERGEADRARHEYETAQHLEPYFAPAAVNLADLDRAQGNDAAGERVLRKALARTPDVSVLHRALGLLLVRRHDLQGAFTELNRAAALAPDDTEAKELVRAFRDQYVQKKGTEKSTQ
jgi:tetratricopeptide (TPR) repeat protein